MKATVTTLRRQGDENAMRMMELFAGNSRAHGTHGVPTKDGLKWAINTTAKTIKGPVTLELWRAHLTGDRPLGVVPICEDGACTWGSIDVDRYDVNLLEIVERVERSKFPLLACRSKSGGLHLFLFLAKPHAASLVQNSLHEMAASLGLAGCEIFPEQTRLLGTGDVGNWIVMPYFGGTFGGKLREQVGLRKTGGEMTIDEFLSVAESLRVAPEAFASLTKRRKKTADDGDKGDDADIADGPPCIQRMVAEKVREHAGRNNALFHFGVLARKKWPRDWEQRLDQFNRNVMVPPLASAEVVDLTRSLAKKGYGYKCHDQPMCGLCERATCLTRKYGVGGQSHPRSASGRSWPRRNPPGQ